MKVLKVAIVIALVLVSCKAPKYANLEKGLYADIETNRGDILVKLHQEDAPLTVSNFVSLAEGTNPNVKDSFKGQKYYDGLRFHRVIKDFMIQGGDPTGTGSGDPGYKFEDEFPKDSLGKLKYIHESEGILSMANSGPGTNGSQFFITHKATPWLNGKHTIFGKVEIGQNVVDSIAQNDTIKHVSFIRVGAKAKKFKAAKVFIAELEKSKIAKEERKKALAEAEKRKIEAEKLMAEMFKKEKEKAVKTASGLQIQTLKKGTGAKTSKDKKITLNFTLYLATGKKIQSTVGGDPFLCEMSKQPMIAGFTEGVLKMKVGGKARLFIPYYLAWGEKGGGPFPPKADVVFEIEVLKVEK